jgi:Ca-activated chloride channel family protein
MKDVISQALNTTSAQVNLIDTDGMPTETDQTILFYDQFSGKVRYNIIQTLNSKGNPDTLALDQFSTYSVVAQTIPPSSVDSVMLIAGRHNHIGIDAPQGHLLIRSNGSKVYQNEKVLIKKTGDHKTINVQFIGTSERYIVGNYDLEIPVFPLIYLRNIEIRQSYTTIVEIPEPGMLHISSRETGYGSLFRLTPEGDQEWVLNIRPGVRKQEYYLQPGNYRIVFRRADLKATMFTKIHDFEIKPGLNEMVDFN